MNKHNTNIRHIKWNHPLYPTYKKMLYRCYNKNATQYMRYGGRGIKVCERWIKSISNFIDDMGVRPKNHTLDRIDNNGDYSPENCRWADKKTQSSNTCRNINITFNNKTQSLKEWSSELGINYGTLQTRIENKWDIQQALTTPVYKGRNQFGLKKIISYNEKSLSISDWAKLTGLSSGLILKRLKKGWSIERVLNKSTKKSYDYNNEKLSLSGLSIKYGKSINKIKLRLYRGWTLDKTINTP